MKPNTIQYHNTYTIGRTLSMSGGAPIKTTITAPNSGVFRGVLITVLGALTSDGVLATMSNIIIEYLNVSSKMIIQDGAALLYNTSNATAQNVRGTNFNIPVDPNMSIELQLRDISAPVQAYGIQVDFVFEKISIASRV